MGRGTSAAACAVVALFASDGRAEPSALDVCTASFEEAQLKQKRGKLVAARDLYKMCAADTCPKMLRDDCVLRGIEIDRILPTASFALRDGAGKDLDAKWTVDGADFPSDGRAHPIDPGPHAVVYSIGSGKPSAEEKVVIHEGEKARVVPFTIQTTAAASAPPPAASEGPGSGYWLTPLIVGGVGMAAVIAGLGFFLTARRDADKRDELYFLSQTTAPSDYASALEYRRAGALRDTSAKRNDTYAFILGGGGAVLIGTSVLLYFVNKPSTKTSIVPVLAPSYAGVALGGSF